MLIRRKCSRSIGCTARRSHSEMHAWLRMRRGAEAAGDVVQETWEDDQWGLPELNPTERL